MVRKKILSERVLILVTIPLTEKRYKKDIKATFGKFYFGRPKEFIKNESFRIGKSWENYFQEVASFLLYDIKEIQENTNCQIDYDVTFKDLKRGIETDQFDVIFLLAHHIKAYGKRKEDLIEFADGGKKTTDVYKLLEKVKDAGKSLLFFVCESNVLESIKDENPSGVNFIGTTSWNLPTVHGFNFVKHWVFQFNGHKDLLEAYSDAISEFLN